VNSLQIKSWFLPATFNRKRDVAMLKSGVVAALIFCCVGSLYAEQVTLKNGDRFTGSIVSMSDKKLVLKTEHAGTISIDFDAISQFSSEQPLVITRTDKQVVSGTVKSEDSQVAVTTPSGTQQIPMADVAVMRSPADQAAYEKSLHPGIMEGWDGGGNFGLALARGNSDTTNLALGFNAERPTTTDKWTIQAASIYSTSVTNGISSTSANALGGFIRYDRNLTKKLFAFGLFAGSYDHAQDLNVRISPSGGLGYHLIASPLTTLDLLGGFGYTYENYRDGVTNNLMNATIGDEFMHKFTANTTVNQDFYFFPYLNDGGGYRGVFDFGLASKLYRAVTWNLNFGDRYNSRPVAGKKDNDVLLTTGLGLTFGGKAK
jgi:putative salt-induced outer membrane protein YdiY